MILGKYNQAKTVYFDLFQVDGIDFEPAATFAAGDVTIMKDEGAEANTTNLPTDEGQGYSLVLTASEMSAARIKIYIVDQTGTKVWLDTSVHVETYGNASAEHAFDLDTASTAQTADHTAGIADIPTVAEFNARTLAAAGYATPTNITAGTITTVTTLTGHTPQTGDTYALANGATGFAAIDTVVDEIATQIGTAGDGLTDITLNAASVDLIWDESLAAHQTALTAGRAMTLGGVAIAETVASGTPTTTEIILTAGSSVDNFYRDSTLRILGGAGAGQAKIVTSYTGSTKTCTFDEAFAVAASNGDAVAITMDHVHPVTEIVAAIDANSTQLAAIVADTEDIQTQIGTAGAGLTDLGGMSTAMKAEVQTEADASLVTYDAPTNAEMEARTPTAAQLAYMVENANTGLPVTFTTSGGSTTTAVLNLVDGSAGSATDDQYNGRLLVFTDGTLKGVVTDITDYVGGTTTATITAIPTAPTASHNARLI